MERGDGPRQALGRTNKMPVQTPEASIRAQMPDSSIHSYDFDEVISRSFISIGIVRRRYVPAPLV